MTTKTKAPKNALRTPQARVLAALKKQGGRLPVMTRDKLSVKAGFNAGSGTINRALHGIAKGSSSGEPYPGLLDLGYVRKLTLDVDGAKETNYQATPAGLKALAAFLKERKLGKVRETAS